jgi:hypothetical protein
VGFPKHPLLEKGLVMIDDNIETNDNAPTAKVLPFNKVTSKVTPSNQNIANAAIVEMLERHLAEAKEGRITFLAHAMLDHNGVAFSTWEPAGGGPGHVTRAMGAVGFLHHMFMDAGLDGCVFHDEIPD